MIRSVWRVGQHKKITALCVQPVSCSQLKVVVPKSAQKEHSLAFKRTSVNSVVQSVKLAIKRQIGAQNVLRMTNICIKLDVFQQIYAYKTKAFLWKTHQKYAKNVL